MGDKKRKNAGKSETLRGKQNDRARQDKRKKKEILTDKDNKRNRIQTNG